MQNGSVPGVGVVRDAIVCRRDALIETGKDLEAMHEGGCGEPEALRLAKIQVLALTTYLEASAKDY
jgi:hypothetical protein